MVKKDDYIGLWMSVISWKGSNEWIICRLSFEFGFGLWFQIRRLDLIRRKRTYTVMVDILNPPYGLDKSDIITPVRIHNILSLGRNRAVFIRTPLKHPDTLGYIYRVILSRGKLVIRNPGRVLSSTHRESL